MFLVHFGFFVIFSTCVLQNAHGENLNDGKVDIHDHPYQVFIRNKKAHVCSGVLISNLHVLTAAYCFARDKKENPQENDWSKYIVIAGSSQSRFRYNGTPRKRRRIKSVKFHPNYDINTIINDNYDTAVITLAKKLGFTDTHKAIALPTHDVSEGDIGDLTGVEVELGANFTQLPVLSLRISQVQVIKKNLCFDILRKETCIQEISDDSCINESGSPFVVNNTLQGIVSRHNLCDDLSPLGIVNVFDHMGFIQQAMDNK